MSREISQRKTSLAVQVITSTGNGCGKAFCRSRSTKSSNSVESCRYVSTAELQILVLAVIFVVTQFVYLSGSNPATTTTATKSSEISTAESSTTDAGSYF